MIDTAAVVLAAAAAWWGYAYAGYPLALAVLSIGRRRPQPAHAARWPSVSICVVTYNQAATISDTIEHLLALDYPAPRRQIVVVSDGSTDSTEEVVRRYRDRGVEFVRSTVRRGKTEAENYAAPRLTGDIIVNTDATVRVDRGAIKALVREFEDPTVGLASGRDVSVAPGDGNGAGPSETRAEGAYVGYEMWVRQLETRVGGIVGASGCLYAALPSVQRHLLPGGTARDFAAPLIARGLGLRAVSVSGATCFVPRSTDLRSEFRRKRRTIVRGMATLAMAPQLLGTERGLLVTWMLASHKLARWLAPLWAVAAAVAGLSLAIRYGWGTPVAAALAGIALVALAGTRGRGLIARLCAPITFGIASNVAVLAAWIAYLRGINPAVWEPTKRQ